MFWPSQDSLDSVDNPEFDDCTKNVNDVMLPPGHCNDNYSPNSHECVDMDFSHQTKDIPEKIVLDKRLTGKEGDSPNENMAVVTRENELKDQNCENMYNSIPACISSFLKAKSDVLQPCSGDMEMITVSEDYMPCSMGNENCNHKPCCHHEEVEVNTSETAPIGDVKIASSQMKENKNMGGLVDGILQNVCNINNQDSSAVTVAKETEKTRDPCSYESIETELLKSSLSTAFQMMNSELTHQVSSGWISNPPISKLNVRFTPFTEFQLSLFSPMAENPEYRLKLLKSSKEAKSAIFNILGEDPRSVYRRQNCCDQLYYFAVDVIHVTCWFDEDVAEVVRIKPVSHVPHCNLSQAKD
ncbi:hypothetical protein ACJMK2_043406 [Sinanodonta woodiana]